MVRVSKHYQLWHLLVAFIVGIVFVMGISFVTTSAMQGEFRPVLRGGSSDSATLQRIEYKVDLIMKSLKVFTGQWTVFTGQWSIFTGQWTVFTNQMTNFTAGAKKSFIDLGQKQGLNFNNYFPVNPKIQTLLKQLNTAQVKLLKKR